MQDQVYYFLLSYVFFFMSSISTCVNPVNYIVLSSLSLNLKEFIYANLILCSLEYVRNFIARFTYRFLLFFFSLSQTFNTFLISSISQRFYTYHSMHLPHECIKNSKNVKSFVAIFLYPSLNIFFIILFCPRFIVHLPFSAQFTRVH